MPKHPSLSLLGIYTFSSSERQSFWWSNFTSNFHSCFAVKLCDWWVLEKGGRGGREEGRFQHRGEERGYVFIHSCFCISVSYARISHIQYYSDWSFIFFFFFAPILDSNPPIHSVSLCFLFIYVYTYIFLYVSDLTLFCFLHISYITLI